MLHENTGGRRQHRRPDAHRPPTRHRTRRLQEHGEDLEGHGTPRKYQARTAPRSSLVLSSFGCKLVGSGCHLQALRLIGVVQDPVEKSVLAQQDRMQAIFCEARR